MSRFADKAILLPLLDRLDLPEGELDRVGKAAMERYRASVLRDIHQLLRSRRPAVDVSREVPRERVPADDLRVNILDTILAYGIPDPGRIDLTLDASKKSYAQEVKRAIEVFEPRVKDVRVDFLKAEASDPGRVQLSVSASLRPPVEGILINMTAMVDLMTGELAIE